VSPYNEKELLEWIKKCLGQFSTAKRITVRIDPAHYQSSNPPMYQLALFSAVLDLEQYLGVRPRLGRVSTVVDLWDFEAPKGHTLKWKGG
jgi:hypothetical protein